MGGITDAIGGVFNKVFGGGDDLADAMNKQNKLSQQAMQRADAEAAKASKAAAEQEAMLAEREAKAKAETEERELRKKKGRKDLLFGSETGVAGEEELATTLG